MKKQKKTYSSEEEFDLDSKRKGKPQKKRAKLKPLKDKFAKYSIIKYYEEE